MPSVKAKKPTCQCCGDRLKNERQIYCSACNAAGCESDKPCLKPLNDDLGVSVDG